MRPWDEEEIAWARECAAAGDTVEEIAQAAGVSVERAKAWLADLPPLTAHQRAVASLYAAGIATRRIGEIIRPGAPAPTLVVRSAVESIRRKGYPLPPHPCPTGVHHD